MFNNPQRAQYAGFSSIVQIDPWITQVMSSCTEHKQPWARYRLVGKELWNDSLVILIDDRNDLKIWEQKKKKKILFLI